MQQRVSLVRAFTLGAPILLMDEPFAALDEITRDQMRYQLLDIWSATDKTVVFVTHSIPEAVILSDFVVTMAARPGRVIAVERIDLPRSRCPRPPRRRRSGPIRARSWCLRSVSPRPAHLAAARPCDCSPPSRPA
jgi:ABC-type nitrate/sulfonate/bicarbonate transport system ATPase subunit